VAKLKKYNQKRSVLMLLLLI